jgi:hypothetical protein
MKYFVVDQGCAASGVSRARVHACCVRGYDGILLLAARHISLNLHTGDLKMALQCVLYVCVCFSCAGGEENTWTNKNRRNRKREKITQWNFMTCTFPQIFLILMRLYRMGNAVARMGKRRNSYKILIALY